MQSLERRKEERSFPSSFPHSSHKVSPTLRLSEEKVHLKKKVTAWTPSEHPRMDTLPPEEPLLSLFFFFFQGKVFSSHHARGHHPAHLCLPEMVQTLVPTRKRIKRAQGTSLVKMQISTSLAKLTHTHPYLSTICP